MHNYAIIDTMKGLTKMNCPRCNSNHVIKQGFARGKQQYLCKDCKRYFYDIKYTNDNPKCPFCGGLSVKNGFRPRKSGNEQRYKCTKCNRSFIKDPKKPVDSRIPLDPSIKCYHCGSNNIGRRGIIRGVKGKHLYWCYSCKTYFVDNPSKRRFSESERTFIESFVVHLGVPVSTVAKALNRKNNEGVAKVARLYKNQVANGGPIIVPNIFKPEVDKELQICTQFTDNEKLYIYENYIRKGVPHNQIMEEFHCSESTIKSIKRMFNKRTKRSEV